MSDALLDQLCGRLPGLRFDCLLLGPGRLVRRKMSRCRLLFEKSIEERETQAAESWRVWHLRVSDLLEHWRYCVSAITTMREVWAKV
jgi:hypothetical protein